MRYLLLIIGFFTLSVPLLVQMHGGEKVAASERGVVLGAAVTNYDVTSDPYSLYIEARILEEINKVRTSHGLDELQRNPVVDVVSRRHSDELAHLPHAQENTLHPVNDTSAPMITHTGATFGLSHNERLETYGVNVEKSGENIIAQPIVDMMFLERDHVILEESLPLNDVIVNGVEAWMNSSEHRANVLLPDYTHTGIGAAISGQHVIVTQVFIQQPS